MSGRGWGRLPGAAAVLAVTLITLIGSMAPGVAGQAGPPAAGEHLTVDGYGRSTFDLGFADAGRQTITFRLDPHWDIRSATIGIRGGPIPVDGASTEPTESWPSDVQLHVIGGRSAEWKFPGTLGRQTLFPKGEETADLFLSRGETANLNLAVPPGNVTGAALTLSSDQRGSSTYTLWIGDSATPIWQGDSSGFTTGPFYPTPARINGVVVTDIDPPFNLDPDVLASGADGRLYVQRNNGPDQGLLDSPKGTQVATGDLLAIAAGDYNLDGQRDVVLSSSAGAFYLLPGVGGGNFVPAAPVQVAPSYLYAVALGDVDGDSAPDLIGGYLNGTFDVVRYSPATDSWGSPVVVPGGRGSMLGVAAADLDGDGVNDLVGANADNSFYWAAGGSTFTPKPPIPAGTGGLHALAVVDVDGDGDLDLVGAGGDGRFNVARNRGAGAFDQTQSVAAALQPLKAMAVGDTDSDGDPDLLGISSDGWLYGSENLGGGRFGDGARLVKVGPAAGSIALGDLDRDGDLDAAVGVGGPSPGVQILFNRRGPFTVEVTAGLPAAVSAYLAAHAAIPGDPAVEVDEWGNRAVHVPVRLRFDGADQGTIALSGLRIAYDWTRQVDLRDALRNSLATSTARPDRDGRVPVSFEITTQTAGTVTVEGIDIVHVPRFEAAITEPAVPLNGDSPILYTNETLRLACRATSDPNGSTPEIGYAWQLVGAPPTVGGGQVSPDRPMELGNGSTLTFAPVTDLKEPLRLQMLPPGGYQFRCTAHASAGTYVDESDTTVIGVLIRPVARPAGADAGFGRAAQGAVVGGALLSIFLLLANATEVGRWSLLGLMLPLYTRLKREEVLDHESRGAIRGYIVANPGEHFNAIRDALGLNNGALAYHLRVLEREGYVRSMRDGLYRRFYPGDRRLPTVKSLTLAQSLILDKIREHPGISQVEIAEKTNSSAQVVNYYVQQLADLQLLRLERDGRKTLCFLVEGRLQKGADGRYTYERQARVGEETS